MPLKIIKRPPSKNLYIRGTVKGREIFVSAGTADKRLAERKRAQLEAELYEEAESPYKTFYEACSAYIKAGGEKTYIPLIMDYVGHYRLDEINQEVVDNKALEALPTQSPATRKRWFYTPIKAVLNHAASLGWCHKPILKSPKEVLPPPEWVEIDWLEKLWSNCNDKVRAITTFLPYTGCRISECLDLTWDRVNLKEGWAYIPKTKTKQPRTVYLTEDVQNALKVIKKDSGQVFEFKDRHAVIREIKRACKRAGIEYKRPHVIGSHTYATWMRRYGGSDELGLLGLGRWKNIKSVQRYAHTIHKEEAVRADKLPRAKNVQSPLSAENRTKKQP